MSTVEVDFAVQRLIASYCHTVDDGRFEEFAELWSEEAVLEVLGQRVEGRGAIHAWMERSQPPHLRGRHVTVNTVVTHDAGAVTSVSDFVFLGRTPDGPRATTTGRYLDTFVEQDGAWRFARREIVIDPRPDPRT